MKWTVEEGVRQIRSSRSPCGERGLKCKEMKALIDLMESLPVRGAWIEMCREGKYPARSHRRSPCGERGLKC